MSRPKGPYYYCELAVKCADPDNWSAIGVLLVFLSGYVDCAIL